MTTPGGMDRNVQVQLTANVDPFQRGMDAAAKSVATLSNGVVTLAKKIDDLWKTAGRKLELFGAGGLASLTAATVAAGHLEEAFRGVRSTAALTGQSVTALTQSTMQLARAIPASNTQIAQLMGQVQDLGIRGTASITKFTEVALRLGAATNTAPGTLFADLLQLTRSMGSNIDNLDRYSSALVDLSKTNGVASEQILGFANAIESVAQRAGYTQTQVLGLSTAFAKAGADSGPGATAFIKITNDISEAVRTGSNVLDQYATIAGKSTAQFKQMAQENPAAAFVAVINSIRDAGPKGISILQQLGLDGARTQRALAGLTSGQANLNKIMNESTDAYVKNTALNKSSNAVYNDLSSAMEKFRTALAQITEALGGPFLGVATKFIEALTKVLNVLGAILDSPVGKIVAGFLAVGSGLSLVAGASVIAVLALLKFSAIWRVLSGAIGTNIFKGMFDGLRGAPRALDDTTAAMTRLYNGTYRLTNRLKGSGMSDGGPSFGRALFGAQGAATFSKGNILGFPMRKLRYEINEMRDTLDPRGGLNSKLMDYRERDDSKVNPVSLNGARVGVQSWLSQHGVDVNSDAAADKAQQANQRLKQIADERANVYKASLAKLDQIRRADPEGFDSLVSGAFPKAKGGITDRHRAAYMNNMAIVAADGAERKLKDSFAQVDEDSAVNPIKRIFTRIKTLSAEMVETMGDGTVKIMDIITTAFAASVTKIVELAAKARIALEEIQTGKAGTASSALATAALDLGGAAAAAGNRVSSLMTRTKAPVTLASASATGDAAARVADMSMLLGYNPRRISPAAGGEDEMIAETGKNRFSRIGSGLGTAADAVGNSLGRLGGVVSGLAMPMMMWGTLLYTGVSALRSYVQGQKKAGEDLANGLAATWGLPQRNQPVPPDKKTPQSMWEISNSKDFLKDNAFVSSLKNMGGGSAGKRSLAAMQYQMLESKGPVSQDQKDAFTEALMHQFGQQQGQALAAQIFSGPSGAVNFGGVYTGAAKASEGWKGPSKKSAALGFQALADASTASTSNLAGVLLSAQAKADKTPEGSPERYQYGTLLDKVSKANSFGKVGGAADIQGYLTALSEGGPQARDAGKQLAEYLKSIGYNGKNAADVLSKINLSLSGVGANGGSSNNPLTQFNKTAFAQAMGLDFDYTNLDTNKARLGLAAGSYRLGTQSGTSAFGSQDYYTNQLSALLQARTTQAVQGDPNRLAMVNQQISSARQGVQGQRSITMSGLEQMGAMSNDIMSMSQGANAQYNIQDIQDEAGQLASLQMNQLDNLKSFILQVRQMNRQREYNEQDHTLQLSHMYRDRKVQLEQSQHDYNESIRSSMYETAQAFGNPGQFVQSQYTQSATSAFTGLTEQNDYLKRSKTAMDSLSKMGLSKDAIRLMGLDDPKNFEQAERFVHDMAANPKLVRQWNASIKDRLSISKGIATDVNNSKFAEMQRSFDYAGKQAAAAFNRSLSDFQTAYDTAQKREKDNITHLVTDAMTGIGDIMQAAKSTGITAIQQYASAIITQAARSNQAIASVINAANAMNMGSSSAGPTGSYSATNLTGGSKGGGYGDVGVAGSGAQFNDRTGTYTPGSTTYVNPGTGSVYSGKIAGSGAGSDYRPSGDFIKQHPAQPSFNKQIAKQMAPSWANGPQWKALEALWTRESGWNQYADNASSSAYGIPQALPGTKMGSAGKDWRTNPATQIAWGLQYIAGRYGSPAGAWDHETRFGWYGDGGIINGRRVIGVGERGPEMVLPLNGSGTTFAAAVVAQTMQRMGLTTAAMRAVRTAGYAGPTQATTYHHVDASQNFMGDITVQSQDPNEMARKLADKKRVAALTRPPGGRV